MRRKTNRAVWLFFFWGIGLVTLVLLLAGEVQTAGALWIMIVCLLPPLLISLRTSYLSVKFYCATTLITQIITVPEFYLQPEQYYFARHRPFSFTALEALPVFLIVGLFLLVMACFVKLAQKGFGASPIKLLKTRRDHGISEFRKVKKIFVIGARGRGISRHSTKYIIAIVLLVIALIPFNFWMFNMGIGITGAQPPRLPYRLSGIFTYLQNYIMPVLLGYFYIKTKRNSFFLAIFLSVYALLLGMSTASRGLVLLVTAPIIAFAWLDRRWGIFSFTILAVGFGVMAVTFSRTIVHISDGITTGSYTELGVLGTLEKVFSLLKWSPEMLLIPVGIVGRIESFQSMFLASRFNPEAVGGAGAIWLKTISMNWVDLGHDAIHMEYLGYTIPRGFYNVAGSLNSWMLMASNNNVLMVLPFAVYAAATLVILEKTIMRSAYKFCIPLRLAQSFLIFVTIWFYTGPGSLIFQALFVASAVLWLIPSLRLKKISYSISENESEIRRPSA